MGNLVLIRGLPGSGKSTMAKTQFSDHLHFEADMYFMGTGKYVYNQSKIGLAHEWCLEQAKGYLERGYDVVVSNTFVRVWEMQPYIKLGYPTKIIEATGNWNNTHGVPDAVIQRMRDRWETFPQG